MSASVIKPISEAIEHTKHILFKPFDFTKWIIIGFCAWLSSLGSTGINFNFNTGNFNGSNQVIQKIRVFAATHLLFVSVAASIVLIIIVLIGIVFLWLRCRGKFMFLHCITENRAEVKIPWSKYKDLANSLFIFKIILVFTGLLLCIPLFVFLFYLIINQQAFIHSKSPLIFLIIYMLFFIIFILIISIFNKFIDDFIVPIMYKNSIYFIDAAKDFLTLLNRNKLRFTGYLLFQIIIGISIAMIVIVCIIFTCCLAAVLLLIPFIGSVLLLPISVFYRLYTLYYLRQYGPEFDLFLL